MFCLCFVFGGLAWCGLVRRLAAKRSRLYVRGYCLCSIGEGLYYSYFQFPTAGKRLGACVIRAARISAGKRLGACVTRAARTSGGYSIIVRHRSHRKQGRRRERCALYSPPPLPQKKTHTPFMKSCKSCKSSLMETIAG